MSRGRSTSPTDVAALTEDVAATWMLRLVVGSGPLPTADPDWDAVARLARRHRCAGVAWLRSASLIRDRAPRAVAAEWQRYVHSRGALARRQLDALGHALRALDARGLRVVVLKGLALSQRLYGDPFVRPTTDLDIHVAAADRAAAHESLTRAGWHHVYGEAPREALYEHPDWGADAHLELHSALFDDELLAYLPAHVPDAEPLTVEEMPVLAHAGPLVPAYLGAHVAKHEHAPLLWLVDILTLWSTLDEPAREAAWAAARRERLHRHLGWAIRRASLLPRAAAGDAAALRALDPFGRRAGLRAGARRLVALAATPLDAARALAGWAVPRHLRRDVPALAKRFRHRLVRMLGPAGGRPPQLPPVVAPDGKPVRVLELDRDGMLALVREVTAGGGSLWVRIRGGSMIPAIPHGALVRLSPLPRRPLRRGDVVLAEVPSGQPVLHRVRGWHGDMVLLQGDHLPVPDPPLPITRVLALADTVSVDGAPTTIAARPRSTPRLALVRLRWRLERLSHV